MITTDDNMSNADWMGWDGSLGVVNYGANKCDTDQDVMVKRAAGT